MNTNTIEIANIKSESSVVRAFKITLPLDKAIDLERSNLRVTWDDRKLPSIDSPLCLFFGAGTLYNRDRKEFLVKGFPINIRYDYPNNKVELSCYYPMPFFKSAKFELTGINPDDTEISYEIRYEPLTVPANSSSYFHATYKDIPNPEFGQDMVYLDTEGEEGQQDWSGSFVGVSYVFSHEGYHRAMEGDPRFFFDDSQTPQAYGTGSEEWGGGGDSWNGTNLTLPFAGHPCGTSNPEMVKDDKDLIESAYRFLLADLMPFGRRAVIRFEHGGENLLPEHFEATTYWYGLPQASLIQTDKIDIGNLTSEEKHSYHSPDASPVESVTSRYEWGIDHFPLGNWARKPGMYEDLPESHENLKGKEIFTTQVKDGRNTTGVSEFTIDISPKNVGVMLRRTLDYSYPNQTAEVYISGVPANNGQDKWNMVGIWYLAGANSFLHSQTKGELGKRELSIITSNRRFRDDEFLIPANFTKGKSAIKVQIKFVPNNQELSPGKPFPQRSAWSELDYEVYSYIIPEFSIEK